MAPGLIYMGVRMEKRNCYEDLFNATPSIDYNYQTSLFCQRVSDKEKKFCNINNEHKA